MEKEIKEVYYKNLEKALKSMGYRTLHKDDDELYMTKTIDEIETFICPEDGKGGMVEELIASIALDSIDTYAIEDSDIDEYAKKCKKVLAEVKADFERAKEKIKE